MLYVIAIFASTCRVHIRWKTLRPEIKLSVIRYFGLSDRQPLIKMQRDVGFYVSRP